MSFILQQSFTVLVTSNLDIHNYIFQQEVAYYQDLDRKAPMKVEATVENGVVKRTLVCSYIDIEF